MVMKMNDDTDYVEAITSEEDYERERMTKLKNAKALKIDEN